MSNFCELSSNFDLYRDILIDAGINVNSVSIKPLSGGANNLTYLVEDELSNKQVLKIYSRHPGDKRDRFFAETNFLKLLSKKSRQLPKIYESDANLGVAVLEWVDGSVVLQPSLEDVKQCANFLSEINQENVLSKASTLSNASEAFFNYEDHFTHLKKRFELILVNADSLPGANHLKISVKFLLKSLKDELENLEYFLEGLPDFEVDIPSNQRIISPSDFGFHNILKRADGLLVFLDFEYAGWDDPAKTLADFFLQPRIQVSPDYEHVFMSEFLRDLNIDRSLIFSRYKVMKTILQLKWIFIVLNIFDPSVLLRKSNILGVPSEKILISHISIASKMMEKVKHGLY